jgi:hypothetical protein
MFSDFWRDILAILGFVLTALGLLYAIVQIRLTKSAAQAAEEAAKKTLAESQLSFQRYAAATAHRFISEAKIHVENKQWEKAAVRINDVADQVAQLAGFDAEWQQYAEKLRNWAAVCQRHAIGELSRFVSLKWIGFLVQLQAKIDSCHGPFKGVGPEASDDT